MTPYTKGALDRLGGPPFDPSPYVPAHATQIDPNSPFWFGLPRDVAETIHPFDDFVLAASTVETTTPEDDLFAGVREQAWSSS